MEAGRESWIRVEVAAHSHVESKAPAPGAPSFRVLCERVGTTNLEDSKGRCLELIFKAGRASTQIPTICASVRDTHPSQKTRRMGPPAFPYAASSILENAEPGTVTTPPDSSLTLN